MTAAAGGGDTDALRRAVLTGYAARLARRLPHHNGYRTIGANSTLAQLHPSTARLAPDEDGLLPRWLVFHQLLQTGRTFLSKARRPTLTGKWPCQTDGTIIPRQDPSALRRPLQQVAWSD